MLNDDLVHIAFAPGSYYRPWQATYAHALPGQQRWLNTCLIRQHALPVPADLSLPNNALARRIVGQWSQLPQVALLMAAARLRRRVLAERSSLALPAMVHAFMRLGHVETTGGPPLGAGSVADPEVLTGWGGRCLQAVAPRLPDWLGARLALPFSGLPGADTMPPSADSTDIDLLWSALRHVETVS